MIVYFDPPFWVGIFEIIDGNTIRSARYVFGAEPTEPQLLEFARESYTHMVFSRPQQIANPARSTTGYKRRMRQIRADMKTPQTATRSQMILKQEYERQNLENREETREERRLLDDRKFLLRKSRRAQKHRGH